MFDTSDFGIGGAAFGTAAGLIGSFSQNESIRKAGSADVAGTELQYDQLDQAAALEVQKRANQSQGIRARLRVLAGDSGFGMDGSYAALEQQANRDQVINDAITRKNAYNQKLSAASRLRASLISLFSGATNPVLAGLQGGLSGGRSGLEIGSYLNGLPSNPGAGADLSLSGYPGEIGIPAGGVATA